MKKYIILLLFITTSYSQTNFQFDYLLEYNFTHHLDSTKSAKVFYLTNSKDNSFYAKITEKDSLNYRLIFKKQNQLFSDLLLTKNNFKKGEIINIDCINIWPFSNPYKYQVENYDYILEKDSTNIKTHSFICLRSEKYKKRKKIGKTTLKFDTNLPFQLPNLFHDTMYEEWIKEKDLPNHVITESSYFNNENKLIWTETLINYSKTFTKINILTKECSDSYLEEKLKLKQ